MVIIRNEQLNEQGYKSVQIRELANKSVECKNDISKQISMQVIEAFVGSERE